MNLLQKNNRYFFVSSWGAYLLSVLLFGTEQKGFFVYTLALLWAFYLLLWFLHAQEDRFFSRGRLTAVSALGLGLGMGGHLCLSQALAGNLFVFSEADAVGYHDLGLFLRDQPLSFTFGHAAEFYRYDDWGAVVLIPLILRLVPHKLFLNAVYFCLGLLTSRKLFDLGRRMMPPRYAFMAALTFTLSSFTLFFYASGLKEAFMICLSTLSMQAFYRFLDSRRAGALAAALFWGLGLLFFRPAVSLFLFVSQGLTLLLMQRRRAVTRYATLGGLFVGLLLLWGLMGESFTRYVGASTDQYLARLDYMASEALGTRASFVVSCVSALIGPFPSILPKSTPQGLSYLSLFAPGLLYRLMLALPFWWGLGRALHRGLVRTFPLFLFPLLEMLSLSLILEGLELRLQMSHLPPVYVFAFWSLYMWDSGQWPPSRGFCTLCNFWPWAVLCVGLLWNLR